MFLKSYAEALYGCEFHVRPAELVDKCPWMAESGGWVQALSHCEYGCLSDLSLCVSGKRTLKSVCVCVSIVLPKARVLVLISILIEIVLEYVEEA